MKLDKWIRRSKKQRKNRYGMQVTGKSVFTIQEINVNNGQKAQKEQKKNGK